MKRLLCATTIDSIVRSVIRKRTFGEAAAMTVSGRTLPLVLGPVE